ncbi:MAG: S-layer homology domain-containing protein [Clostridia bacterium]|nr:S-layer homology domain-containing protein [Clostridia bacterium]
MKKIIALLLAIMMLPIFTVVSQAATTMTEQEFQEVLLGEQTTSSVNHYGAGLIRAYRNISQDQLDALRSFYNGTTGFDAGDVSPMPSAVPAMTDDEEVILAYGFIKLMTFPDAKSGQVENGKVKTSVNEIAFDSNYYVSNDATTINDDIDRAVAAFYTDVTVGSTTANPADVLNKATGYNMTKNALGAFVIDFQKNLRAEAAANIGSFLTAYVTGGAAAYVDAIIPYVKNAAAKAFDDSATVGDQLFAAKTAMLNPANGMLVLDLSNVDKENSHFIKLLVHAINELKNFDADVAAVVMNTVMSGVMDAVVEVYADAAATQKIATVEPNNLVATLNVGSTVYLKVVSNEFAKLFEHGSGEESLGGLATFNPSLSASLDAALVDADDNLLTYATVDRQSGLLKVTGSAAGSGILKLYRDTNSAFLFNDPTRHNDKELFMELNLTVQTTPPSTGGGAISRVEAPTITFEVDGDKNITVTLETATNGATIYYTTDGTAPTKKSQKYEGPFQVEDGTTIKAFAVKNGYIDSYVTTDKIDLQGGLTPTLTGEHIAYVHGRDTGNFDADDNVTRGEVSAMFSRLLVKKMVFKDDSVSQFTDVVEGAWHTPYIKYLSNVKIINGYEDGTFKPDAPITRAEFATIASRFFELEKGAENTFVDVTDSHWAKEYIDSAVIKGWLKGYEDGTFKPDQAIKRSEAVTIVNRMLNRAADKAYIEANYEKVLDYPDIDESHWAYYEILEASNWHDHKVENNQESWTDIFYQERFNAS